MNEEALRTSISVTPLHDPRLLLERVFACEANESTTLGAIAYDLRCEDCLKVAIAHMKAGNDPRVEMRKGTTKETIEGNLSDLIVDAIKRYGWTVRY